MSNYVLSTDGNSHPKPGGAWYGPDQPDPTAAAIAAERSAGRDLLLVRRSVLEFAESALEDAANAGVSDALRSRLLRAAARIEEALR